VNDEFAAKLLPGKTLADLKELIRENMGVEKLKQVNEIKVNQIVEQLLKQTSFELPEEILTRETQQQANAIVEEGSQLGASDDDIVSNQEEIFSIATTRAENNLRSNFILQEIAEAEQIQVSDSDLIVHISRIAESRKEPITKVIKQLQKTRRIQSIRNSLRMAKTIDFLVEQVTVIEVTPEELEATQA
jgi:trigger factor